LINLASLQKGVTIRAPRIVLLGVEKIGKTTFACGSQFSGGKMVNTGLNNPAGIPIKGEEGMDDLDIFKFPRCGNHEDIMECLGVLYNDKHDCETVVLDSASALEPIIWDTLCEEQGVDSIEKVDGGFGKGYGSALNKWREITDGIDALREEKNMTSIIIGHVDVKRFDDPTAESYDQYQFDIHKKARNLLFRWADVILFANTKVIVNKEEVGFKKTQKKGKDITGGQRFLFTQGRPAHPGGGRGVYGNLPYELPLEWQKFQDAVAGCMPKTKKK
jgi:hypothetical protein